MVAESHTVTRVSTCRRYNFLSLIVVLSVLMGMNVVAGEVKQPSAGEPGSEMLPLLHDPALMSGGGS